MGLTTEPIMAQEWIKVGKAISKQATKAIKKTVRKLQLLHAQLKMRQIDKLIHPEMQVDRQQLHLNIVRFNAVHVLDMASICIMATSISVLHVLAMDIKL